jgi:hypothetical protein
VDVIAILDSASATIETAYAEFLNGDAPIESIDRFPVDEVLDGSSVDTRQYLARRACAAFVRCAIRVPDVTVKYATSELAQLPGVVRLFTNEAKAEVVLEIVAEGKRALDTAVMSTIQGQASIVKATRTYIVINHMQWLRDAPASIPTLFMSVADADVAFARDLRKRLEGDCEIQCWLFDDIPLGSDSWTDVVDQAIGDARSAIFVTSKTALTSTECAREFGVVDALFDARDICVLVLPDCEINELPTRYQQRQCLKATEFFAYSRIVDWVLNRDAELSP